MLRYLLEKEFKQIRRDRFMPKIIFIIPIMQLIILPFAANFEMRNINLSIVDNDHSVTSMQLVDKVLSSGYFRLTDRSDRYDEALTSVESNESDIILEIPSDFERDLGTGETFICSIVPFSFSLTIFKAEIDPPIIVSKNTMMPGTI